MQLARRRQVLKGLVRVLLCRKATVVRLANCEAGRGSGLEPCFRFERLLGPKREIADAVGRCRVPRRLAIWGESG